MNDVNTTRPFQERFLDGYNRSQLRREVEKVKPFGSLRTRYATMALSVSLAVGGLAAPLHLYQPIDPYGRREPPASEEPAPQLARKIALELKNRVDRGFAAVSDEIRADFFLKQVPFGSIIYDEAKKNNVSPELVAAVARAESSFQPAARSERGAVGVMQLVPRTGRWLGATDLTDPIQNIMAGAKYLGYLSERFDGNEEHVIAAYNAGEGNVRRFGGVPPFSETRDYIRKVRRFQSDLRAGMEGHVADAGPRS